MKITSCVVHIFYMQGSLTPILSRTLPNATRASWPNDTPHRTQKHLVPHNPTKSHHPCWVNSISRLHMNTMIKLFQIQIVIQIWDFCSLKEKQKNVIDFTSPNLIIFQLQFLKIIWFLNQVIIYLTNKILNFHKIH